MNKLLALSLATFVSLPAFSAVVKSARLDNSQEFIQVDVELKGGCGPHQFRLTINDCDKADPDQCEARLRHTDKDNCEGTMKRTLSFPISSFNDSFFEGSKLKITGDKIPGTDDPSSATVTLPKSL